MGIRFIQLCAALLLLLSGVRGWSADGPPIGARAEVFVQLGHIAPITDLSFAPDGHTLLSSALDGTLKLWESEGGRELATLQGHVGPVTAGVIAPDGTLIASAGRDRTVRLWDAATGTLRTTLTGHENVVLAVAFAPNSALLASAGLDRVIRLWSRDGQEKGRFNDPVGAVRALEFSPDGRWLAAAGESGETVVLDLANESVAQRLSMPGGALTALRFAPDGNLLAIGGQDGQLRLWERQSGALARAWNAHRGPISGMLFGPDGQTLRTTGQDGAMHLWSVASGAGTALATVSGVTEIYALAGSRDGRLFATGGQDHTVQVWRQSDNTVVERLGHRATAIQALDLAPDGRTLLVAGGDHRVRLWDLALGQLRLQPMLPTMAEAVRFAPEGKRFAVAGADGVVRLLDSRNGAVVEQRPGATGALHALAFSPDGRQLAAGGADETVYLWSEGQQQPLRLTGHQGGIRGLAFALDGRLLASASADETVRLWDVATGQPVRTLKGHRNRVNAVLFLPGGTRLASAGEDSRILLWPLDGPGEPQTLLGQHAPIKALGLAGDGQTLLSAGVDGRVAFWSLAAGPVRDPLRVGNGQLRALASGGTMMALALDGGTLALHDNTGQGERARLYGFPDGDWITVTPDGHFNASPQGARFMRVRIGDTVHGLEQFLESFFRPDLVALALAGDRAKQTGQTTTTSTAQATTTDRPRLEQVLPAPRVTIVETPTEVTGNQVEIKLQVEDQGGGIGDIRIYINGTAVRLDAGRGWQRSALTFPVGLVAGDNQVRAVAFNADNSMQSRDALLHIKALAAKSDKPKLQALVVGIEEFINPKLRLKYSVSDAKLFAQILREKSAGLFSAVQVRTLLTPEETTREAIVAALNHMRATVNPEDLFVFYVASHGTVDEGLYYLVTANVGSTASNRLSRDALDQNTIKALIANIPATKKLIVLDTCNAGQMGNAIQVALLTRGMSEDTATKVLSRAVGSTVLSAASSVQEALEGYQGHGLFTQVVVTGLAGQADMDRDGFVKTTELADYVDNEVPELAEKVFKHKQYPIISPSGMGFPITRIGK